MVTTNGSFIVGTPTSKPDRDVGEDPQHRVIIRTGTTTPFWFSKTISVQQANYYASTPYANGPRGGDSLILQLPRQCSIGAGTTPNGPVNDNSSGPRPSFGEQRPAWSVIWGARARRRHTGTGGQHAVGAATPIGPTGP
jgi:hypothetical protein